MSMKPPIPKHDLLALIKSVASGDNSRNVMIKEQYHLADHQRNLLNTMYLLARTRLFKKVEISKIK